jgi:hypothetical protein
VIAPVRIDRRLTALDGQGVGVRARLPPWARRDRQQERALGVPFRADGCLGEDEEPDGACGAQGGRGGLGWAAVKTMKGLLAS